MRKLIFIGVACLGVATLFLVDRSLVDHRREREDIALQATTDLCAVRLENAISQRLDTVEALAALFFMHPGTTQSEFNHFASILLEANPPIRALQYADPDTRISHTYPDKGNEITVVKPMLLLDDPERGPYVKKAIAEKRATLQGPFELRQGGQGVVFRLPIFSENRFVGLAVGVYDAHVLVDEALAGIDTRQVTIRLADDEGKIFWGTGNLDDGFLEKSFPVADVRWSVAVRQMPSNPDASAVPRLLVWVFGIGFIVSTLMFGFAFWTRSERLEKMVATRTRDLSTSNALLADEIARQQKAEKALKRYKTQLSRLNVHLQKTIEAERNSVARDMHDNLAQILTALKMDLGWLKKRLAPDQQRLSEKISDMEGQLKSTVQSIKQICNDWHPGILDNLGLVSTLEWYVADFNHRNSVRVQLSAAPLAIEPDHSQGLTIYRVIQEALANAARHTDATTIDITLSRIPRGIQAEIVDNGSGVPSAELDSDHAMAIAGMRERVHSCGGQFDISAAPGHGTVIQLTLPGPENSPSPA